MATSIPKKSLVSGVFKQLLLTGSLSAAAMNCGATKEDPPGRKVTTGERVLVEGMAGCQTDTGPIRIEAKDGNHFGPSTAGTVVADAHPSSLALHFRQDANWDYASGDFSKEEQSYWKFRTFAHEWAHTWQYQNVSNWESLRCATYSYTLAPGRDLLRDYCLEQIAEIVADYMLFFLHPKHINYNWAPTPANIELIKGLVEPYFPGAQQAREAYTDEKFRAGIADDPEHDAFDIFRNGPNKCLKNADYRSPRGSFASVAPGKMEEDHAEHSIAFNPKVHTFNTLHRDYTVRRGRVIHRNDDLREAMIEYRLKKQQKEERERVTTP